MRKTRRSLWGAFWCWFMGTHIGNVQWGEKVDNKLKIKCSFCYKIKKEN